MIVSNGTIPIITKPTRVTPESSTIIDHIITNDSNHQIKSFIFEVDVTDHYPILCQKDKRKSNISKKHSDVYFKNKSIFTPEIFCEDLKNNLHFFFFNLPLLTKDNFNENFEKFTNIVSSTIDKHAPLTKLLRGQLKLYCKPWLTKGIINSIKNKRKMFKPHYILGTKREKSYLKKYINVRGLFKKYPTFLYKTHNTMNFENFIQSPSKYSPWWCTHFSQRFCHF